MEFAVRFESESELLIWHKGPRLSRGLCFLLLWNSV